MNNLLLTYYGDDFTGSTDVMEALTRGGVKTVLFLEPPSPEMLQRFDGVQVVGIAGTARSLSPEAMDRVLPPLFHALRALNAPTTHYKICSTFDSSPQIGSIGHAIELAQSIFDSPFVPLLAAIPILGRYAVFGTLFARSGIESDVFRLDRHPTMRSHPITPMDEADLRVHLSRQTQRPIELFEALMYERPVDVQAQHFARLTANGAPIVLFDALYDSHLEAIGRLIGGCGSSDAPLLTVGSSGIEQALLAYWREHELIAPHPPLAAAGAVAQVLVISGSVSPVTEKQIGLALEDGFAHVPVQPDHLVDDKRSQGEIDRAADEAVKLLNAGRSVIIHSARGPDDPRVEQMQMQLTRMGFSDLDIKLNSGSLLGAGLGEIGLRVLREHPLERVCLSGGDTSSYTARRMGIEALEVHAPFAPAMPFCRASAPNSPLDGAEMIFKGGQTGKWDFFSGVKRGSA